MKIYHLVAALFIGNLFFSGSRIQPRPVEPCCSGTRLSLDQLKKFMLDSLRKDHFEGGVYSKKELLDKIRNTPGDSVYILNVLIDCIPAQRTGLAITSPKAPAVNIVRQNSYYDPYCPCPGKLSCCTYFGIALINRDRMKFRPHK